MEDIDYRSDEIPQNKKHNLTLVGIDNIPQGCYYISLSPDNSHIQEPLHGTLRLEYNDPDSFTLSGDLYKVAQSEIFHTNIPVFKRDLYSHYLELLSLELSDHKLYLKGQLWMYNHQKHKFIRTDKTPFQLIIDTSSAILPETNLMRGSFMTNDGDKWSVKINYVSRFFRKAKIKIGVAPGSKAPQIDGLQSNMSSWKEVFEKIGWELDVETKNIPVTQHNVSWTLDRLTKELSKPQSASVLDKIWQYYLLCVPKISHPGFHSAGFMFDRETYLQNNKLPREGAVIASEWPFPGPQGTWCQNCEGSIKDIPLAYTRLALHEIGHAMGLSHSEDEVSLMNTTRSVAEKLRERFPEEIDLTFSELQAESDAHKLRHAPDPYVRPGMAVFGRMAFNYPFPDLIDLGIQLKLTPVNTRLPIGAPVRFNYEMQNLGEDAINVPKDISLKSHSVSGYVINPRGVRKEFSRLYLQMDSEEEYEPLKNNSPDKTSSMSLLWGNDGPLFHLTGNYQVFLKIRCGDDGMAIKKAKALIEIYKPESALDLKTARRFLKKHQLFLAMVIKSSEYESLFKDILDNEELRPHYLYIYLRNKIRYQSLSKTELAELKEYMSLLSDEERKKAVDMINYLESNHH